jgi:uncharacterized protein (TIGR02118 family)
MAKGRQLLVREEVRMIKVSVFYPNQDGGRFDIAYYCEKHMTMVQRLCGPALKGLAVEHGMSRMAPGSAAPFMAMGHLYFDSAEAFHGAFGPHLDEILSDVPKYTSVQPSIQVSEVKL